LRIGHHLSIDSVRPREILVLTRTRLERPILRVVRNVVVASDTIVDVFAELVVVLARRIASLEAESVATQEEMPFDDLGGRAGPCF
jgi:hypothetical protein